MHSLAQAFLQTGAMDGLTASMAAMKRIVLTALHFYRINAVVVQNASRLQFSTTLIVGKRLLFLWRFLAILNGVRKLY